jgi:hypothetical protein
MESESLCVAKASDAELVRYLRRVHGQALRLAAAFRYEGDAAWDVHILSIYGSIVELSHAVAVLVEGDARVGVSIILRSMLEGWVDLRNLAADKAYGYQLETNALEEKLRFMRHVQKDRSEATKSVREDADFPSKLAKYEEMLKKNTEKAGPRDGRTIAARFKRAGLQVIYQTIYAGLCSSAHNDSMALTARHLVFRDGTDPVSFHRKWAPDELKSELSFVIDILTDSTEVIHSAMKSEVVE